MLPFDTILEDRFSKWNPLRFLPFGGKNRVERPERMDREEIEDDPHRPKVGLVLSSGAAKGLAHIGVIQVLEENGIHIDAIAATSMGAYVGACWASGLDGEELEAFAAEIQTSRDRFQLLDPVFPPREGFLKGEKIVRRLKRTIGDVHFEDLKRKLYVVATEMGTYEAHIFQEGSVLEAVHASLAIPGIFKPVTIGDRQFVDGGVSDPLPVQALKAAGMDRVIAVSVIPTVEELRTWREADRQDADDASWFGRTGRLLNRHLNYFARGNVLDVLRNSAMGSQIRVAEFNAAMADVYLRPIVCSGSWHDYHKYRTYVACGREEAQAHLHELRAVSAPAVEGLLTANHFQPPTPS